MPKRTEKTMLTKIQEPMLKFKLNYVWRRLYSSSTAEWSDNYLNCHISFILSAKTLHLKSLLQSHSYIITTGHLNNLFIASKLISLYASISEPNLSAQVFNSIKNKDTFIWNSIIKAHFSNGNYSLALEYYHEMRLSDFLPNNFTIPLVVSASAEFFSVTEGKRIHGLVSKLGLFEANCAIGSSFVYMYSLCGCMQDAAHVFEEMPIRDVVAWTALVTGYVRNDESEKGLEHLCEMHRIGGDKERPNYRTLEGGFLAYGNLGASFEGRCLHGLVIKTGFGHTQVVQSSILSMYAKCGNPEGAYLSFCELGFKDLISWTCVIGVYARLEDSTICSWFFQQMLFAGLNPDGILVACVLSSFINSEKAYEGKAFHAVILRRNYISGLFVYNALISMYCRLGLFVCADKVFRQVKDDDHEPWYIMILEYGKVGLKSECLELFREMQYLGIESNSNHLISVVISSCSKLKAGNLGRSLHCYAVKNLMHENISVANSLLDMYARNGSSITTWKIFDRMQKDTVTWNTLISYYAHCGQLSEAFELFEKMIFENFKPNEATLVTMLSICAQMTSLEKGKRIHSYVKEGGFGCNIAIATGLVDLYSKCGKLKEAREIFDSIKEKDVISWNVMISAYGMHGDVNSAIEMFQQIERSGFRPNEVTFLAVLSACNHVGLVEEGKYIFNKMREEYYSLSPTLKHYACMVDLLGRSGNLHEAQRLVLSMPMNPDGGVWGALLSSCKVHNDIELGTRIAKCAIESDPENDGYYVILADMYTSLGRWDEAEKVRMMMREVGVKKIAGCSTI